jgi:ABC-type branched-subunit amino acid transport system permease subunit
MTTMTANPKRRDMSHRFSRFGERHRSISVIIGISLVATLLPLVILLPPFSSFSGQQVWVNQFTDAGVYVILALGLNIVVGMAGLLDLGYAAFFAIGAYTFAYAASPQFHNDIPFWVMLVGGAAVAALFGILLGAPTLRLRGDYLAIVTLGFGEIVPIVFLNSRQYTNGPTGIGGIYPPRIGDYTFPLVGNSWPLYVTMVGIIVIVMILVYRLQSSRLGRSWAAIREDELAAAASGINTVVTKLLAFALGASVAGIAGVFFSSKLTLVSPSTVSFTILAMVVLGGMGNPWGVAIGAFVLYLIQFVFLKQLNIVFDNLGPLPLVGDFFMKIDFIQYQFLLYGIALVAMMLVRPEGLFPSRRRRQELHTEEDEAFGEQGDALGTSPE